MIGNYQLKMGGALYLSNSNITISDSIFSSNKAIEGGAIYYYCNGLTKCTVSISNSSFLDNIATVDGGAIKYNFYRPEILNSTFRNNTASYGPNIASYPIKIGLKGNQDKQITFTNVGSGISENITIEWALYDHDGQITSFDNYSLLELKSISPNTEVRGNFNVKVISGVGVFDNIVFMGPPGTQNVRYSLDSKSLDMNILK